MVAAGPGRGNGGRVVKKWNLVIDVAKCFNCNCCALACNDEYGDNEFPGYAARMQKHGQRWIDIKHRETGQVPTVEVSYLPVMCNHCDNPACLKVAKDGAVVKRPDGIVLIVPEKARGQKQIVDACPYGAVFWNEEQQLPQAWPFDAHLLDAGWTRTRGSQVCPTQAMRTLHVTDEEMKALVAGEGLEVLSPELGTQPRVYYRNLARFRSVFIGGALAGEIAGVVECIADARVRLVRSGKTLAEQRSDTFGEFRFSGIAPGSGAYTLHVEAKGFREKVIEVQVQGESVCLGAIELQPVGAPSAVAAGELVTA
jgi:Fe-S-cluster-containing dehydrogenase component